MDNLYDTEFNKEGWYEYLKDSYDSPGHLMYKKMRLVLGTITGGRAILDFGCGQGELLRREMDRFDRVVGIDVSEKALELTRKNLKDSPKAELYLYEDSMPSMDGGFDWVTCLDVLEHLEDPVRVLRELHGLMSPGGRLIVAVPNWYDIINSKLLGRNKYHIQTHTPWGWMAMLKKAGFAVTSVRAVDFPVIGSDLLARLLYFFGMCIFILAEKR